MKYHKYPIESIDSNMSAASPGRRSEFSEVLRQQPVTAAQPEALRFDKILGVDKAGPDVALIKLQRLGW